MPSIRERNGSYQITVSVGRDFEGRQLFERCTFHPTESTPAKIRKEVEAFAISFEKRAKEGKYLDAEKITYRDFTEIWFKDWAPQNLTQSGLEDYYRIIKKRAFPTIGNIKLSKIKAAHIQAIYSGMLSSGLSPQTVRRNHVAINSVFRYAYKMGIVQDNICDRIELPKIKEVEKLRYFTLEQSRNFLNYLTKPQEYTYKAHDRIHQNGIPYKVKEYTQKKPMPLQFYVYFTLAIYGGFRRGELIGLKWSDVDLKKETISINRSVAKTKALGQIEKSTKTKAGNRTLKMPSICFNILKEWQKEQKILSMNLGTAWKGHRGKDFKDNYIFIKLDSGERMDLDTPGKKFKKIIENYNSLCEAETDKLPNIRLHDLRHTQATLLLSQGVDIETVAHRMGHSKASVTLDVYGHWMEETDTKAAETLSKMFQEA